MLGALLVLGVSTLVYTNALSASEYLTAEHIDGVYFAVYGDGIESGFQLSKKVTGPSTLDAEKSFQAERENNSANCHAQTIELAEFRAFSFSSVVSNLGTWQLTLKVESSVAGDTGGCLVILRNDYTKRVEAIVQYLYVTDY